MAYMYELCDCGIREIILQNQKDSTLFASITLYEEDGTFCDSRIVTNRIKDEWGGYFYISPSDAADNKNRIYVQ